jgi:hypothetical protein
MEVANVLNCIEVIGSFVVSDVSSLCCVAKWIPLVVHHGTTHVVVVRHSFNQFHCNKSSGFLLGRLLFTHVPSARARESFDHFPQLPNGRKAFGILWRCSGGQLNCEGKRVECIAHRPVLLC